MSRHTARRIGWAILTLLLAGCLGLEPDSYVDRLNADQKKIDDPRSIAIPDLYLVVTGPPTACADGNTVELVEGKDRSVIVDCDTVTLRISRWMTPTELAPPLVDALVEGGTVTWRESAGDVFRIVAQGIPDGELAEVAWSVIASYPVVEAFQVPPGFAIQEATTTAYPPTNPPRPVTTR